MIYAPTQRSWHRRKCTIYKWMLKDKLNRVTIDMLAWIPQRSEMFRMVLIKYQELYTCVDQEHSRLWDHNVVNSLFIIRYWSSIVSIFIIKDRSNMMAPVFKSIHFLGVCTYCQFYYTCLLKQLYLSPK